MAEDRTDIPLGGALSERMALRLAALHGSSPAAIEATIALWPFGWRVTLHALGIISDAPEEELQARGEPSHFELTPFGEQLVAECATWAGPDAAARWEAEAGRRQGINR
jgi:hypothetical protein